VSEFFEGFPLNNTQPTVIFEYIYRPLGKSAEIWIRVRR